MENVELTEDYNALRQTLFRFAEGTLIHNDYNLSLEVIADDVAGIGMGVPDKLSCDFYEMLNGNAKAANSYAGEFMAQYSWAEIDAAYLQNKRK